MKKIFSLVLILALLSVSCGALAEFDFSAVENNPNYIMTVINSECIQIKSIMKDEDLAVTFSCADPTQVSTVRTNIGVMTFPTKNLGSFFLEFRLFSTKELSVNGLSIVLKGKKYTFNDLDSEGMYAEKSDSGYYLNIILDLGSLNMELFGAIVDGIGDMLNDEAHPETTVILHGSEDITIELGEYFWLDALAYVLTYVQSGADLTWIMDMEGTPYTITDPVK